MTDSKSMTKEDSAARLGPTGLQTIICLLALGGLIYFGIAAPTAAFYALIISAQVIFLVYSACRIGFLILSHHRGQAAYSSSDISLPRYTVMVALYDESAILPDLVRRLSCLDYPLDRLEGFLLLESHDHRTLRAAEAINLPSWLRIVVVPVGCPQTKPRALNHGLSMATGDLVTIYDAEDEPHPLQLRRAAEAFAADHTGRLACVQAPLRIRRAGDTGSKSPFMDRQFAVEYAALFEVTLPALSRLRMPFPLGGTSNHFRHVALKQVHGWDAYNVTEDADLGFRLWRSGWRLGVIDTPTLESPPGPLRVWLPQRTRWLKGYLQTLGVHTRRPWKLGPKAHLSLFLTLGMALVSAAAYAPAILWLTTYVIVAGVGGAMPDIPALALWTLLLGTMSAWAHGLIGARRAGVDYGLSDMLRAPLYWSLLSLAFFHAVWRLVFEPHRWDKTAHASEPVAAEALKNDLITVTGRQAA